MFDKLWLDLIQSKDMTTEIVITLSHFTRGRKSVDCWLQIKMTSSTCQKELSLDTQTVLTRARCYLPEGCSSAVPHPRHAMFHSLKLHNNQEPGDGYVPATDLTEFLDEADISEGPLADPMHVENHGRGPGDTIDENHVGDHMVRGPGDPEKHVDAVNIYMIMSTTLTNPIQDMSNIFGTARLFT